MPAHGGSAGSSGRAAAQIGQRWVGVEGGRRDGGGGGRRRGRRRKGGGLGLLGAAGWAEERGGELPSGAGGGVGGHGLARLGMFWHRLAAFGLARFISDQHRSQAPNVPPPLRVEQGGHGVRWGGEGVILASSSPGRRGEGTVVPIKLEEDWGVEEWGSCPGPLSAPERGLGTVPVPFQPGEGLEDVAVTLQPRRGFVADPVPFQAREDLGMFLSMQGVGGLLRSPHPANPDMGKGRGGCHHPFPSRRGFGALSQPLTIPGKFWGLSQFPSSPAPHSSTCRAAGQLGAS